MINSKDIFEKILVNNIEIDLDELNDNNGKYNVGESNTECNVEYVLKNKKMIPNNLFQNNKTIFKAYIPNSIEKIGKNTFINSSLRFINNLNNNISIDNSSFSNLNDLTRYDNYEDVIYDSIINEVIVNDNSNNENNNEENIINVLNMKQVTLKSGTPFISQINKNDCIYVIKNNFTITEDFNLPENSILIFIEGTLSGQKNNNTVYKLIGKNSSIFVYGNHKVFTNIDIQGSWRCAGNIAWFATPSIIGPYNNNENVYTVSTYNEQSDEIQLALDSSFRELIFPQAAFYVNKTLNLRKEKKLTFLGPKMKLGIDVCEKSIENHSILFTNQNITLLDIDLNEGSWQKTVEISGGTFDVSLCANYNKSVIRVLCDKNQKIWGFNIDSNIIGRNDASTGIGLDINPIDKRSDESYNNTNKAYVTQLKISSTIANFETGLKAQNYMVSTNYYNWCTDLVFDGLITACKTCIDTNVDSDLKGTLQAKKFWYDNTGGLNNNGTLIKFSGVRCAISSNIYDIYAGTNHWDVSTQSIYTTEPYSQRYALDVTNESAKVIPYGIFKSFLFEGSWLNTNIIKGYVYTSNENKIHNPNFNGDGSVYSNDQY